MTKPHRSDLRTRRIPVLVLVVLVAAAGQVALAPLAAAATTTWTVTTAGDSSGDPDCSGTSCTTLRGAIATAGSGDGIVFGPAVGKITLTEGQLEIDKNLTIDGTGAGPVTIDANQSSRVFLIAAGATVTLRGLTITGGDAGADEHGGGILNSGTLLLDDCTVEANTAGHGGGIASYPDSGNGGKGIQPAATLTTYASIENSSIRNNSAIYGGGILNYAENADEVAILEVVNTWIGGNVAAADGGADAKGGGIANNGAGGTAIITIQGGTITGNTSTHFGGGIANYSSGDAGVATLSVARGDVSGNAAELVGGGIANFAADGTATVNVKYRTVITFNTAGFEADNDGIVFGLPGAGADPNPNPSPGTFQTYGEDPGNDGGGGGIFNSGKNPGTGIINVERSEISNNMADYGGGIASSFWEFDDDGLPINTATLEVLVSESTIATNVSMWWGGGIYSDGELKVNSSTVSGNMTGGDGGGMGNYGTAAVLNSTIANNSAFGAVAEGYGHGGGIDNWGYGELSGSDSDESAELILLFTTIAGNSALYGGGIATNANATTRALTTIVAGNTRLQSNGVTAQMPLPTGIDCSGTPLDSYGYNIDGDGSCGLTEEGDLPSQSVRRVLATDRDGFPVLRDNGGLTETIALIAGSPAIDALPKEIKVSGQSYAAPELGTRGHVGMFWPDVDQRGVTRPQGAGRDIGAYEYVHPAPPASGPLVDRVMGYDRYGTAVAVSQAAFPGGGVPVVYVATGLEFPDALAGSAAALRAGGPLLLVRTDSIPQIVADELARLQPARIVVQGGSAAVSDAVVDQLRGYTTGGVTRNAGATRYETAALTAGAFTGTGGTVILATGGVFADALAAGSLYGSYLGPVLLTKPGAGLAADTRAQLARLNPSRVFLLGGTGAVSAGVEAEVKALGFEVVRLGGTDRYETSALVGEWVRARAGYGSTALAATGKTFPDGLTAGVLAGKWNAPVLLTNGTCWSPATKSFLDRLNPARVTLLGGLAAQGLGVANLTTCR